MRRVTAAALALLAVLFLLPVLALQGGTAAGEAPLPSGTIPLHQSAADASGGADRERGVTVLLEDGSVERLSMDEYLWGVVAAEMPASFQLEALKAQAVAARTYTARKQASGSSAHPQAEVCTDSGCCQAWITREEALVNWGERGEEYREKIARAVEETDGLGVLYQGEPIQAVFFSSAPGATVDAGQVWGSDVPYLVSVASPEGEEVPNYRSQLTFTAQEFRELVLERYPGADLSGEPGSWLDNFVLGGGGTVASVDVGGVTLTGGEVRALLGLRSACFTVAASGEELTFSVTGYGHGVGMSQYGANALAREGKTFRDILTWYYTGAQVGPLWQGAAKSTAG